MPISILIAVLCLSLSSACFLRRAGDVPAASDTTGTQATAVEPVPVPKAASAASDAFVDTVRPILVQRCSPCHEPGGKMYSTMPFDQPETIRNHRAGTLKRFSGEEHLAIEAWLASTSK